MGDREDQGFWISSLSLLIAAVGFVGQFALSTIRMEQAEIRKEQAELDLNKAMRTRESVWIEVTSLALRRDSVSRSLDSLKNENVVLAAVNQNLKSRVVSIDRATQSISLPVGTREEIKSASRGGLLRCNVLLRG